ncbi:MAG: hypothetical protein U0Z26_11975 [Anaerolineales bacterium]
MLFANNRLTYSNQNTNYPAISPSATFSSPFGLPSAVIIHPTSIPSDYLTHVSETFTATATSTSDPHACVFPLAQTTTKESISQEYIFSNPQVVLTGDYPDIAEWLPDNQNVVIMSLKLHKFDGIDGSLQTIKLFNPETKETQVYATRRNFGNEPLAWDSALNAIIYLAPNALGIDKITNRLIINRQIRISDGNPDTTQLLLDNLQDYHPMAFNPNRSQFVYWDTNDKQSFKLYKHQSLEPEYLIPSDSALFGDKGYPIPYEMTWRPNASQLFLYSDRNPTKQTFLVDANTGRACTLNFGGWAYFARWSPNGRYLAVIKSNGPMSPIWSIYDMAVLDMLTGKIYPIEVNKLIPPVGARCCTDIIQDFVWGSDNQHLAVVGIVADFSTSPRPQESFIYLVDFLSGEVNNPFTTYQFHIDRWGTGLVWSPDGSKILAKCPTGYEGRLCLISVTTSNK